MMNSKIKKTVALVSAIAALSSAFCGCSKKEEDKVAKVQDMPDITFPLAEEQELTYWAPIQIGSCTNLGDTELYKELQKRTGVKIKFIHPARGQEKENLNIIIASNELPDIFEGPFDGYQGGAAKAVKVGVLTPLNDYMDKYLTNYKAVLDANPDMDADAKTDDGTYYKFGCFHEIPEMAVYAGPVVRKDWLDQLGLDEPVTIDDWYEMLKAFKTIPGVEAPFTTLLSWVKSFRSFMGAYGVGEGFYHDDGVVKFGPIQDGYKQFLELMNKWYSEGLIDPDFATLDSKTVNAKMTTGKSGAMFGGAGGSIGSYTRILAPTGGSVVGVDYPVLEEGQVSEFGQGGAVSPAYGCAYVSGQCKNIPLAMKLLDYGYSEEGSMLFNFGIEGKSYDMVDGYPTYKDEIKNNTEGLAAALGNYARGAYNGPFVQDKRYIEQYYSLPVQQEAWAKWSKTKINDHNLDNISYTEEENNEISTYKSDIDTYVDEMMIKFIIGVEPIENFDKFVATLKGMGLDEYTAVVQQAYDRFKNR